MKKLLTILLVALLILGGFTGPGTARADASAFRTFGDIWDYESPGYGCEDDRYVRLFLADGICYRADATLTDEQFRQFMDIDIFDPDAEQKAKALLSALPIEHLYDLSAALLSQADLDALVGKTGQELLDMGFEYGMGYSFWDDTQFYMNNGLFSYTVYMNEKVPEREDYDAVLDELFRPMTVQKVEVDGIADIASDIDLLW